MTTTFRADEGLAFLLQYENVAWYDAGEVRILDRRVYPAKTEFVTCRTHGEVAQAIRDMVTQSAGPYTAAAMGMALAALLERCLPEQPGRGLDERRAGALRSALITGAALVLHNLPEGVLTLFAGAADSALGLRMALAVALHNLPEGLAVALPLYYATGSRRQAVGAAFASGLAEPAGAVLAYALVGGRLRPGFLNGLLVLVAGVMVWVSLAQLVPTALAFGGRRAGAAGFGAGVAVMAIGIALLS